MVIQIENGILLEISPERANEAKIQINTGQYQRIFVTGGIFETGQEGISLARALRSYLESQFITERIEIEEHSLTTIHNVELLKKLLSYDDNITVITSDYHAKRTRLIWKLLAKKDVKVIGVKSSEKGKKKKIFVEIVGIFITYLYWIGTKSPLLNSFKWPEKLFRKAYRTV